MKKLFSLTFFFALSFSIFCPAQEAKFGKITPEELKMTTYEKDTAASAVVLYENMETYYEYDNDLFFRVINRYFVRIKIDRKSVV